MCEAFTVMFYNIISIQFFFSSDQKLENVEIALSVAYAPSQDYGITPPHDIKTIKEDLTGIFFFKGLLKFICSASWDCHKIEEE